MNLNPGMGVADLFTVDSLVYVAFLASVSGLLTRDELRLRVLILIGSGFYLAYYRMAPDTPLWGAIITNSALACANLYMIFVVISERTTFAMDRDTLHIYRLFDKLSPGQFRRLFRLAGNVDGGARNGTDGSWQPGAQAFLCRRWSGGDPKRRDGDRACRADLYRRDRVSDRAGRVRVCVGQGGIALPCVGA